MKIVMLCDFYDERLQYQENLLARYYVKHGHDVTILAATFDNAFDYYADRYDPRAPRREYLDGKVKVIKLPYSINFLNKLRKFPGVAGILEAERPDLIYVHDIHLNLAEAGDYKRRHPACRIIMDYHADYSNSGRNWLSLKILHGMIRKRVLYRDKDLIDKILPVVPAGFVFLNEVYGVPNEEMELLPLGADTDHAREVRAARAGEAIRRQFGIPGNAIVIFTGGKLTPVKMTHVLLEAFLAVSDGRIHLLVVGDAGPRGGQYRERLERQAAGHPRVHFAGWVDGGDVYRYMDACDFAVFPASQSVLWQQALSMGLPLIVGRGIPQGDQDPSYLNLYGNVLILPQADIRADVIAGKIREYASDRPLLERLRAAALRATDELLDYDRIVEQTLR